MPRSTESQIDQKSSSIVSLRRLIPSFSLARRKVFFDSPGLLEQSQHWGGLVIWTIAAGSTAALFWAFFGRVDQTVTASGTLQPVSGKMIVSAPVGGIVRDLFVSDGEMVTKGKSDGCGKEGTKARLYSTQKQLALFVYETSFLTFFLINQADLT